MASEEIDLDLSDIKKENEDIPKSGESVHFGLKESARRKLLYHAELNNYSPSAFIRMIILQAIG